MQSNTDFVELDDLALSLIHGGDFDPDHTPSGEHEHPDGTGRELSCTEVFAGGHCSGKCVGGLLEDWKRLKGQQPK